MAEADISVSEIRDLLRQIRGIESVEVRQAPTGGIEGIDIAISPPTAERRVVRDVESALMSGLGIHVDHRAISIHRANGEPERVTTGNGAGSAESSIATPAEAAKSLAARFMQPAGVYEDRIRLEHVRCEADGERYCDITVTLRATDGIVERTVREVDTHRGRMLAAGRAMADAITALLGDEAAIALEGVEEFSISEAAGLLALLRIRQGRVRQDFYGAALVEGDPTEAAARAVLDAMNRFLETRDRNATTT
jgi:hypothetical protein